MSVTDNKKSSFTIWPYAVVTVMVLFMAYIVFFVVKAMRLDVDLVSKDYYEQELKFQDHINSVDRTVALGDVDVTYRPDQEDILIQLPESFKGQKLAGKIVLFRPSDNKLDRELPLQPGRDLSQLVEAGDLEKGLWKLRVSFNAGDEKYYKEKRILIK